MSWMNELKMFSVMWMMRFRHWIRFFSFSSCSSIRSSTESGKSIRMPSMYGRKLNSVFVSDSNLQMIVIKMSIRVLWCPLFTNLR